MALQKLHLGTLSLGTGAGAKSNVLSARELARASAFVFYNDSAYTGTISVLVGPREDNVIGDLVALANNGTAVTLTAGLVERFDVNGFESIAIKTSGTEGAARSVDVYAIVDIGI